MDLVFTLEYIVLSLYRERYSRSALNPGTKSGQGAKAVVLAGVGGQHTHVSKVPAQYVPVVDNVRLVQTCCVVLTIKLHLKAISDLFRNAQR